MSNPNTNAGAGLHELKFRLLFVVIAIFVFRIGAHIPVPGLDPVKLSNLFNQLNSTMVGFLNMFSGGALQRFTVLALGVMPYISASIIIQLLGAVVPALEQMKKEGEAGKRKMNRYTRYLTLMLAFFQAVAASKLLATQNVVIDPSISFYLVAAITLTTGTMFLVWLGEQMTEKGIGNGISLIIFSGIVAGLPSAISRTFEMVRQGQIQPISVIFIALLVLAVMAFVVFVERGQRRITVNYAKRQQGRKLYAAQSTHLPFKINMAGVIPPIFAASILSLPTWLSGLGANSLNPNSKLSWLADIGYLFQPNSPLYIILEVVAIVFFSFFYTALVYNPKETSDNLKKSGAFIPGIRPGEQTTRYIDQVMTRLTLVGSIYLVFVVLLPQIMKTVWHVSFNFGGTSLLIIVVVLMDFIAQINAHLMSHQYESLMKKSGNKGGNMPGAGLLR